MDELGKQSELPGQAITKDQLVVWSKKIEAIKPEINLGRNLVVVDSKKDKVDREQRLDPDNTNSKVRREIVTNLLGIDLTNNLIVTESIGRPAYKLNQRLTGEIMYRIIASAQKFNLIPDSEQQARLAALNAFVEVNYRKWQILSDLAITQGQKPEDLNHRALNGLLKTSFTNQGIPLESNHDPLPPNGLDTILAKFNQALDSRQS